jgi:hypothetical protein
MPMFVWVMIWVALIGTVAFLAIREIRSGRRGPNEFDTMSHEAQREAGINRDGRGPNGPASLWGG